MQAARGTQVTDPGSGSGDLPTPLLTDRRAWALFALVWAALYATDQVTKSLAVDRLAGGDHVSVVGELLQLHLTRNPGAAFSLGTRFTVLISGLAIVATIVVLWLSRRLVDRTWAVGLGAVLAGITGNLTDRLLREPSPFRGHVIDFLQLPNWPIFNVADIAINLGAVVILVQVFRGIALDGRRVPVRDPEGEEPDAEEDQA